MVFVEKNVQELQQEYDLLLQKAGAHELDYAAGAVQVIEWILHGKARPSSQLSAVKGE
jgi:hypothetical protein